MLTTAVVILSIVWIAFFAYYVINTEHKTTFASILSIFIAYFAGYGAADWILKAATWIAQ